MKTKIRKGWRVETEGGESKREPEKERKRQRRRKRAREGEIGP